MWIKLITAKKNKPKKTERKKKGGGSYYLSQLFNKMEENFVDSLIMDYFRGEYLGGWT